MYITQYLAELVDKELGGDRSRFEELWELLPDFSERLRAFDSDGSWLHWSPKMFDGWYCVSRPQGFDVYVQDRGQQSDRRHFVDEQEAMMFAIDVSVFDLGHAFVPSRWQTLPTE